MSTPITAIRIVRYFDNWFTVLLDSTKLSHEKKVYYKLRDGAKFSIPTNRNVIGLFNEVYFGDCYDLGSIVEHEKPLTIVDVGAHIGIFTVLAARRIPDSKVYAYEPSPYNYQFLVENVKLNGLEKRVHTFSMAVAGEEQDRLLFLHPDTVGNTLYPYPESKFPAVLRHTTTLDKILETNKLERVDLLKIDCEDAELEIFESTDESTFRRITRISIEMRSNHVTELLKLLRTQGYQATSRVADIKRKLVYVYAQADRL
ncbi:MAG: FkbM family methyltransferase [Conexivisphaerales archaeon]